MMDTPQPFISGILLAAGLSTRMGQPKQLLPFGNSTIVETVVDSMIAAKFDEVIVVVGHCAEQIQELLAERPVKIVYNANYHEGMLTSAQAGVKSLNLTKDGDTLCESTVINRTAFSLMLVDQPFITSVLIDKVVDAYANTHKDIVLPSYNFQRGHPVIFNHKYTETILALGVNSGGVRSLYNNHKEDIHYVEVDTNAVLRDIDYQEDYKRALKENE